MIAFEWIVGTDNMGTVKALFFSALSSFPWIVYRYIMLMEEDLKSE
jgi:hypothetical protein